MPEPRVPRTAAQSWPRSALPPQEVRRLVREGTRRPDEQQGGSQGLSRVVATGPWRQRFARSRRLVEWSYGIAVNVNSYPARQWPKQKLMPLLGSTPPQPLASLNASTARPCPLTENLAWLSRVFSLVSDNPSGLSLALKVKNKPSGPFFCGVSLADHGGGTALWRLCRMCRLPTVRLT